MCKDQQIKIVSITSKISNSDKSNSGTNKKKS